MNAKKGSCSDSSSIEDEDIGLRKGGIRKCRRKSRIDKINEKVKGWTSSPKQQQYPPKRTNTKEETGL